MNNSSIMRYLLPFLCFAFLLASCEPEPFEPIPAAEALQSSTLDLQFNFKNGTQSISIGDEFMDGSYPVLFEGLNFYISDIKLVAENDAQVALSEIELVNGEDPTLSFEVPAGEYSSLQFDLGVPASLNTDNDPASFPNAHPLGFTGSQGMFWTWNVGYIFVKFDGRANTDGNTNGDYNEPIFYHCGNDDFLTTLTFPVDVDASEGEDNSVLLNLQLDALLSQGVESIDIANEEETGTHTTGDAGYELAHRFMQNFEASLSVQ